MLIVRLFGEQTERKLMVPLSFGSREVSGFFSALLYSKSSALQNAV